MREATGPLMVLPSDQLTDENVMLWSTSTFPKIVNGGSGFTPTDQELARETMTTFPDPVSVAYLHRIGVHTVIVLKDRVIGTSYAGAMDAPINGLGITRTDEGDAIVYQLP
jgi:hypothetical protein